MTEQTSLDAALGELPETPAVEAAPEPAEAQPEPTPEPPVEASKPEPAPEPAPAQPPEMVPVGVVQELRRELRELKQARQPQEPKPEPLDPEYASHMEKALAERDFAYTAQVKRLEAYVAHGKDRVDTALKAAEEAGMIDTLGTQADAWEQLMAWHSGVEAQAKAQEILTEIGGDPAAYREKLAAEIRAQVEAEMVAKQAKAAAPSLANVTGTGGGPRTTWSGPTSLGSILPD